MIVDHLGPPNRHKGHHQRLGQHQPSDPGRPHRLQRGQQIWNRDAVMACQFGAGRRRHHRVDSPRHLVQHPVMADLQIVMSKEFSTPAYLSGRTALESTSTRASPRTSSTTPCPASASWSMAPGSSPRATATRPATATSTTGRCRSSTPRPRPSTWWPTRSRSTRPLSRPATPSRSIGPATSPAPAPSAARSTSVSTSPTTATSRPATCSSTRSSGVGGTTAGHLRPVVTRAD